MRRGPWEALQALGDPLPTGGLDRYVAELSRWNQTIRLVGPRDLAGIRLQVVDAVLPFLHVTPRYPLLDIGSGAGLPGVILGLLHPEAPIYCMEPRLKRVAFLRHVCRTLGLKGVRVLPVRTDAALAAEPALAQSMATITARAVGEVVLLLEAGLPFLAPGGSVILPRGGSEETRAALPEGWECTEVLHYQAPAPLGSRCVQRFVRRAGECFT